MKRATHYVVTVGYFVRVQEGEDARDAAEIVLQELVRERPQFYRVRRATKRELAMPTVQPQIEQAEDFNPGNSQED